MTSTSTSTAPTPDLCPMAPYAHTSHTTTELLAQWSYERSPWYPALAWEDASENLRGAFLRSAGRFLTAPIVRAALSDDTQTTITDRSGEPEAVFQAMLARIEAAPEADESAEGLRERKLARIRQLAEQWAQLTHWDYKGSPKVAEARANSANDAARILLNVLDGGDLL